MQDVFIGRQSIFDRHNNVTSYELLFRSANNKFLDDEDAMTAKVMVNTLMDIGLENIAGNKRVNINATESFLLSGLIDLLPNDKVGIEILESVNPTPEVLEVCHELKHKGYFLMLDDVVYEPRLEPLLKIVDVIKVDLPLVKNLEEDVKILRQFKGKLLAEKVEDLADYKRAYNLGFDYFQGYYFCKPDILSGKTMNDSKIAILRAMQKIMSASVVSELQDVIKQDVSLSYRLLKYINSAAFGISKEIDSIERALVLLGLQKTRQWLSVLSMSSLGEGKPSELVRTALYRGYLLENIAKETGQTHSSDDFLIGMFSVLDALLDQPMKQALAELPLPRTVRETLLREDSSSTFKLDYLYALEHGDWVKTTSLESFFSPLTSNDLNRLNLAALNWSDMQISQIQNV